MRIKHGKASDAKIEMKAGGLEVDFWEDCYE